MHTKHGGNPFRRNAVALVPRWCIVPPAAPTKEAIVHLTIPPVTGLVPSTKYEGFTLNPTLDPRADSVREIRSEQLLLAYPPALILNAERAQLAQRGIILGIGLAFALMEHPEAIPASFRLKQHGEPIKIITSTRMRSEYDNRNYLAYFYCNEDGTVTTSYVAERPWASSCPSPVINPA